MAVGMVSDFVPQFENLPNDFRVPLDVKPSYKKGCPSPVPLKDFQNIRGGCRGWPIVKCQGNAVRSLLTSVDYFAEAIIG